MSRSAAMQPSSDPRSRERGQVLVIFALSIVAIIAMTGLVIDGGGAFVQRRDQQNTADAAAMAGAYAYVNSSGSVSAATSAALSTAASNGYTNGSDGVVVTVNVVPGDAKTGRVSVKVEKPHRNYFSGLVGFATFPVGATAAADTGVPNGAYGVMPLIFNKKVWNSNAHDPTHPVKFDEPGTGTEDVPQTATQFNWTVFCTANGNPCNGDSNTVNDIINDNGSPQVVTLDMEIGPLNAGSHTTLFSSLSAAVGNKYPVAIVNDDGEMLGWAMFHLTGSIGGSTKQIEGWFETDFNDPPLVIIPGGGTGSTAFGSYYVRLTN